MLNYSRIIALIFYKYSKLYLHFGDVNNKNILFE